MNHAIDQKDVLKSILSEDQARHWFWLNRFNGKQFCCTHCNSEVFYEIRSRPEIRTCAGCHRQVRMRTGTLMQNSKLPALIWVKALVAIIEDRNLTLKNLKSQLSLKSFGTAWGIKQRICIAMDVKPEEVEEIVANG